MIECVCRTPDLPLLWVCPQHGKCARDDFQTLFLRWAQLPGMTWSAFWDIAWGVLASERVRCLLQARHYFEEDYLLPDLERHLETLAHRFGHPGLAIPTPRPLEVRELPRWRRWLLTLALPKVKEE